MPTQPTSVEIRTYQVGFGDCFLLSFVYGAKRRNVLIDFGSTGLPKTAGKKTAGDGSGSGAYMKRIADDITAACGPDSLTAVVATHRHADHISGFATDGAAGKSGEVIRDLHPKVVLQPWTEDPEAKEDATKATRDSSRSRKSFVAGLAAMHHIAQWAVDLARRPPAWMSAAVQKELSFLGMDNIANRSAIDNLIALGQQGEARWLHHGAASGLERYLPGVKVHVLGPPNLEQTESIRKMRKTDPDQFWQLLAGTASLQLPRGSRRRGADALPAEARWFRDRLDRLTGAQVLEIVRTLDEQMNNTSVILLFEVLGRKLLFPGDAQLENWSYALRDAPDAEATRALLAGVDVYKVGHHGSLNATPKLLLWENFAKRKGAELHTLLSTMKGKHGKTASNTEVPRRTLVQALRKQSQLQDTEDLGFGANAPLCHVLTVTRSAVTP